MNIILLLNIPGALSQFTLDQKKGDKIILTFYKIGYNHQYERYAVKKQAAYKQAQIDRLSVLW